MKVWLLVETEYAGQCTGFSSNSTILAIFSSKLDIKTLAPALGKHLSRDMGVAISQVMSLIETGEFDPSSDYGLALVEWEVI